MRSTTADRSSTATTYRANAASPQPATRHVTSHTRISYRLQWCRPHPQNRKYTTHRNAVRGGRSHGHGQQAKKISGSLDTWFLRYVSGTT